MVERARVERQQPIDIEVENPVAGVRTIVPATNLDPRQSPFSENFLILYGELVRRHGYKKFGNASLPLAGPPVMRLSPFDKEDGTKKFIAITTDKIYDWDGSEWVAITQIGPDTDLTGTDLDIPDVCQQLDNFIYTNGVDTARKWSGSGNTAVVLASLIARFCEAWLNRVFFAYVNDGSGTVSSRIKWSANGSITDFAGLGSGAADLLDTPGEITRIRKISSGEMAVYKPKFIDVIVPTGIAASPVAVIPGRVEGIGNIVPFGVVDIGGRHIFPSLEGLRLFDGNTAVPIAESIKNVLFSGINQARIRTGFATARPELGLYYLWIPSGGASNPDIVWVVDYVNDTSVRLALPATAAGVHATGSAPTIDSVNVPIDDYNVRFDDLILSSSSPLYVIGKTDGRTHQLDDTQTSDDGVAIAAEWQSKDFRPLPNRMVRLSHVVVEARAGSVAAGLVCEASTDHGVIWMPSTPATEAAVAGGAFTKLIFYFSNTTGEYVRFRLRSQAAPSISIRYYSIRVTDAGRVLDII